MLEMLERKRDDRIATQVGRAVKRVATAADRMRRNDIAAMVFKQKGF